MTHGDSFHPFHSWKRASLFPLLKEKPYQVDASNTYKRIDMHAGNQFPENAVLSYSPFVFIDTRRLLFDDALYTTSLPNFFPPSARLAFPYVKFFKNTRSVTYEIFEFFFFSSDFRKKAIVAASGIALQSHVPIYRCKSKSRTRTQSRIKFNY